MARDDRGISELLGTIVIVALVVVTSTLLIGVGVSIVTSYSDSVEDRLAQDAVLTLDDRLANAAGTPLTATTEIRFPQATSEDVSAHPSAGTITVRVSTVDEFQEEVTAATDPSGHAPATVTIEMGTLRYVDGNGVETVYQGGAVFERQDSLTTVLSVPWLDYTGASLDLSIPDISRLEHAPVSGLLVTQKSQSATRDRSEAIHQQLESQWNITGDDRQAPVNVTLEIETEYVEGWKQYSERGMMVPPDRIEPREESIVLEFHRVGGGTVSPAAVDCNNPDRQPFERTIEFTGLSQCAQYSQHTTPVEGGPGFTIDDAHQIAVYDREESMWAVHWGGDDWRYEMPGQVEDGAEQWADPDDFLLEYEGSGEGEGEPGTRYRFERDTVVCFSPADGPDIRALVAGISGSEGSGTVDCEQQLVGLGSIDDIGDPEYSRVDRRLGPQSRGSPVDVAVTVFEFE